MRRLLFVAALGVLAATAAGADEAPKEKALFEERFAGGLGKEWSWLREEPKAWHVEEGALVLRTLPGYLHANSNDSKNVLLTIHAGKTRFNSIKPASVTRSHPARSRDRREVSPFRWARPESVNGSHQPRPRDRREVSPFKWARPASVNCLQEDRRRSRREGSPFRWARPALVTCLQKDRSSD